MLANSESNTTLDIQSGSAAGTQLSRCCCRVLFFCTLNCCGTDAIKSQFPQINSFAPDGQVSLHITHVKARELLKWMN